MATLNFGTPKPLLGTGLHLVGGPSGAEGRLVVQVADVAGAFSLTFRAGAHGSDPTASSPQLGYRNASLSPDAAGVAGATAITANGLYDVPAGGKSVGLHVTAGTATVTVSLAEH